MLEYALGHGAMATVYRAFDPTLGRRVAIKVLNPAVASHESGSERFRREAMAVAALRHPNIVEVYDFVPASDGNSSYLVEELIVGETLQSLLEARGGSFIPEVAAIIAAEVAEALSAAHQHGVVHRDVKPANIMIERRDQNARVVLADFGVAHVGDMTTMTATGAMVGSPAYMSPEQARGQAVGGTVDVWALGVLLYQMATGKLPFPGRDPITVVTAICKGEYKRASQIDARVGPELDRIIVGCLRPVTTERYQSAREVALLLRACAGRVGLVQAGAVVRQLLDQPTKLAEDLAPKLAAHAVQSARSFIRKRQLARALAELGRAMAHVPNHFEATRLIESLSSQRKWLRVVALIGATAVVIGGGFAVGKQISGRARTPMLRAVDATAGKAPAPLPPSRGDTADKPAVTVAPTAAPAVAKAVHGIRKKRARERPVAVANVVHAAIPTAEPVAETAAPEPPPAPTATPTAPLQPAAVKLFARFAFCFPSLDGDTIRKAPPRAYDMVVPGLHQVYCALTQDGPRLAVGQLDVKPGARVDVHIVPDATGQPKILTGQQISPR